MPKKKPIKIQHKVRDAIYQLARKKGKIGSADGLTDAELHAIWHKNCSIKYTIQLERTNYQLNFALGKQLNTIEFQQKHIEKLQKCVNETIAQYEGVLASKQEEVETMDKEREQVCQKFFEHIRTTLNFDRLRKALPKDYVKELYDELPENQDDWKTAMGTNPKDWQISTTLTESGNTHTKVSANINMKGKHDDNKVSITKTKPVSKPTKSNGEDTKH